MKPLFRLIVAALVAAALPFSGASAAPDRSGIAAKGAPYEWDGGVATGTAFENVIGEVETPAVPVGGITVGDQTVPVVGTVPGMVVADGLQCTKDPTAYCETVLVGFDLALTAEEVAAGKTRKSGNAQIAIDNPTVAAYDYDLAVYESDAEGARGAQVGTSGAFDETPGEEALDVPIKGTIDEPTDYYLVEVIYFTSVQGNYKGHATVTGTPRAA